jgi:hypothetical protein
LLLPKTNPGALQVVPGGTLWNNLDTIAPGATWEKYVIKDQGLTAPEANNFKNFDGFDFACSLGVSCKAMNLDLPGYTNNPSSVYGALKKYVDDAANFTTETKLGFRVDGSQIPNRTIELAIPPNPTPSQMQQLQRAIDYAKKNNIKLNINMVH